MFNFINSFKYKKNYLNNNNTNTNLIIIIMVIKILMIYDDVDLNTRPFNQYNIYIVMITMIIIMLQFTKFLVGHMFGDCVSAFCFW